MKSKWYIENGPQGDVVLSSRVRLARNLTDVPFPNRLTPLEMRKVGERVIAAFYASDKTFLDDYRIVYMEEIAENLAMSLVEQHIISPQFAENRTGRTLILRKDDAISIMICEEDHLRIQAMRAGLDLEKAYEETQKIDNMISKQLPFAFNTVLGYLTQCPSNLGTGMRASALLHLPVLTSSGQVSRLSSSVSKLGLTMRGNYGEGSSAMGDLYQLSNQVTLGISEEIAIRNLDAIAMQFAKRERSMRETLMQTSDFKDKIGRAIGTLKYAHVLSIDEFMVLMSLARLGVSANVIDGKKMEDINELMNLAQPASLSLGMPQECSGADIQKERANKVRDAFQHTEIKG